MGIHDSEKYPAIKHLLGIPEDEPIFIMRAQDDAAMQTIPEYAKCALNVGASKEFVRDVADLSMAFASWRGDNRDKCKTPDL